MRIDLGEAPKQASCAPSSKLAAAAARRSDSVLQRPHLKALTKRPANNSTRSNSSDNNASGHKFVSAQFFFYSGILDNRVVVDCGRVCQFLHKHAMWVGIFRLNIGAGARGMEAESRHEVGITFFSRSCFMPGLS